MIPHLRFIRCKINIEPQTFFDIDYVLNCIASKLLRPLQDSEHFPRSLFCVLIFLCYQMISWFQMFVIQTSILNTNLLWTLLIYIYEQENYCVKFHAFLLRTWYNLEYLIMNKNHIGLVFFCNVVLYLSRWNKWISFEEEDALCRFLSLIFETV